MSGKSIMLSVLSVLLFVGLLVATIFLFRIEWIVGVAGIVVMVFVPPIVVRKAYTAASGILDRLIAKFIVPVLFLVGLAATLLIFFQ